MDHGDQFRVIGHISPVTIGLNTTPPVSEIIDTEGFQGGRCVVFMQTGNIGRETLKCFLSESDDNVAYTTFMNMTDTDIDGAAGAILDLDDDNLDIVFDVPLTVSRKRYFKLTDSSGSTGSGKNTVGCTAYISGRTIGAKQSTERNTKRPNSRIFRAKNGN